MINLDIGMGDYLLGGRFKNQRITVKSIGTDDLGQPTVNKKKLLSFRIEKKMPEDQQSGKTKRENAEIDKESGFQAVYDEAFNDELEKIAKVGKGTVKLIAKKIWSPGTVKKRKAVEKAIKKYRYETYALGGKARNLRASERGIVAGMLHSESAARENLIRRVGVIGGAALLSSAGIAGTLASKKKDK